jgi:hypothetical protein
VSADKEKARLEKAMASLKASWSLERCSIIMDGWTGCWNRPLINIIVSSIFVTYILTAIDCSGQEKKTLFLKDQLCDTIAEVRQSNVFQVVIDANLVCKVAGIMIQKGYRLVTSLIYHFYIRF